MRFSGLRSTIVWTRYSFPESVLHGKAICGWNALLADKLLPLIKENDDIIWVRELPPVTVRQRTA